MNDSKKVSRIEWLCAAMIDFIPIIIFSKLEMIFLNQHLCFRDAIFVATVLLAVYMLLKDFLFDGRSIGKRFVNIRIVRPENYDKDCLILRNLPLSVVLLMWLLCDLNMFPSESRILFILYMWADIICFALKGKTIGDSLAHTTLEVSENPNFLLQKNVSKRIACFVVVLILFGNEGFSVSPFFLVKTFAETFNLLQIPTLYTHLFSFLFWINTLYTCVVYVYILYKMIDHKTLREMVVVLFGGFICFFFMLKMEISYVPLAFMLLYVVIIAALLYMTTDRRLGDSQIRTDFENRFWRGCDLQKVKNHVIIVAMVLIMSVLLNIVFSFNESLADRNSPVVSLSSALFSILIAMFPVVYLSKKYINQESLRWIIYGTSLLGVIISLSPYWWCLIYPC